MSEGKAVTKSPLITVSSVPHGGTFRGLAQVPTQTDFKASVQEDGGCV